MTRKDFLKKMALLGGASAVFTGVYAWQIEPFWLELVHQNMPIKNLPPDLAGKTLMQISDMHIGNRFNRQFIIDSFKKAQTLQPDFVVYTGDFISYESDEQLTQLTEVFEHIVRGNLATIGILGNHDYGKNWADSQLATQITEILHNKGMTILRNETKSQNGLYITGLDDYWGTNYNPNEVLQSINLNQANIVLCHNPDVADQPIWGNYNSWILSGHTHGGQVKPPFLDPPMLPVKNKRYTCGKFEVSGKTLYINRALGHLWQVRCNVRPEITVFTLNAT
jgi:predicted MPP superfamily phosphohydrolase